MSVHIPMQVPLVEGLLEAGPHLPHSLLPKGQNDPPLHFTPTHVHQREGTSQRGQCARSVSQPVLMLRSDCSPFAPKPAHSSRFLPLCPSEAGVALKVRKSRFILDLHRACRTSQPWV